MSSRSTQKEMTFLEHLEELRRVVIDAVIALAVAAVGGWFASGWALDRLIAHTVPEGVPVVFLGPAEAFANRLRVALTIAVLVALPYMSWRAWQFVVPGLLASERRILLPLSMASTVLFYLGSGFALGILVPIVVRILLSFGTGSLTPTMAIGALLGFVLRLCLACGVVFQMPLVAAVLTRLGIVTPAWLWQRWRLAVLFIFVASALLTPGDGPSQLVLGVPVTGLYFLSIAVSRAVYRRQYQEEEHEKQEPEGQQQEPEQQQQKGEDRR